MAGGVSDGPGYGRSRWRPVELPGARVARWRRGLQVALGLVWLLDAALQFQPFMFGRGFATQVIAPTAQGNPAVIAHVVLWGAHTLAAHPVLWNALFATAQLVIALGLLWRPTMRIALAGSVAWSLSVWWLGEGLGGVLAGTADPLTGAPGAVLLYALLAVLAWPSDRDGHSIAAASVLGRGALAAWLALWGSEVWFALRPANDSAAAWRGTFAGLADGEPGWLRAVDGWAAGVAGHHGAALAPTFAAFLALTALAVLVPAAPSRVLLVIAMVGLAAVWLLAQNFGGILTGQATDPNSAPLLALLALAHWPLGEPRRRRAGVPSRGGLDVAGAPT